MKLEGIKTLTFGELVAWRSPNSHGALEVPWAKQDGMMIMFDTGRESSGLPANDSMQMMAELCTSMQLTYVGAVYSDYW